MDTTLIVALLSSLCGALLIGVFILVMRKPRLTSGTIHTSLERVRSMGELTVLSAYIKEVVTMKVNEDATFTSTGKIILICPYRIEFRYDLRKTKISKNDNQITVILPPHKAEPIPGKIEFYDERKSAVLGFFKTDFEVEVRNKMLHDASVQAIKQAAIMQEDLQEQVRHSVRSTLAPLFSALGSTQMEFVFEDTASIVQQLSGQQIAT